MSDIVAAKRHLRAEMRSRRAGIPADHALTAARMVADSLAEAALGAKGAIIAGYVAIRGELDPMPALEALARRGARLVLPRIGKDGMLFGAYASGDDLSPGAYGIPEPSPEAPELIPDIVLAPLLAFDRQGGRLGYGAGYYDRAIAACAPRLVIGVAFACQEVAAVPTEAHDRPLDLMVTEQGLIDCRQDRSA